MTDSFADEKNDGACLPCEKKEENLLEKLESIDDFKSILSIFFEEFEKQKNHFISCDDKITVYDKEDDSYRLIEIPFSEREQIAREKLCFDSAGWFSEIVTETDVSLKLVDLFRKLAKEKYL